MTIYPYLLDGVWVFDDSAHDLKAEAFVLGASEMISALVANKKIRNAERGFAMHFSDEPQGKWWDASLSLMSPPDAAFNLGLPIDTLPEDGNWYEGFVGDQHMICWLCPSLFCYFDAAPTFIYVEAEALNPNHHSRVPVSSH
jgi:hypothetical protein